MNDLRAEILKNAGGKRIAAVIIADDQGILSGVHGVKEEAERLGLSLESILEEGRSVEKGEEIAKISGTPVKIALAEDVLMGLISKPSGIATAARRFVDKAGQRPKIVAGAWKKMPGSLKEMIRNAVATGGASYRISDAPFIYLDKNYVKMLGGIKESLEAVAHLEGYQKVLQLKNGNNDIISEALEAVEYGAAIVFIDTGQVSHVKKVIDRLNQTGMRDKVKIAFGGGVSLEHINELKVLDIDILDIGRQIIDAPLLDMKMEITAVEE
jgi:nicotinate-nucleotide pyrophosphorylase (carboxylating)